MQVKETPYFQKKTVPSTDERGAKVFAQDAGGTPSVFCKKIKNKLGAWFCFKPRSSQLQCRACRMHVPFKNCFYTYVGVAIFFHREYLGFIQASPSPQCFHLVQNSVSDILKALGFAYFGGMKVASYFQLLSL